MTFPAIAPPLLFAVFVWWFATGLILWLDRLPRATFRWSFAAASLVAGVAAFALVSVADDPSAHGAYVAFACAIALWGWHEMSFLMGFILGPRSEPCPADAHGWRRFKLAAATLIHHEIAIALTALAIVAFTWGQPNQIGAATFFILWVMRLSAKFNLFLGARHRGEDLLPAHLAHLKSYFRDRSMNALFPLSMIGGAGLAGTFALMAFAPGAAPHQFVGYALLLGLTALALIEHAFLFVPPPNAMLWGWAVKSSSSGRKPVRAEPVSTTSCE